MAVDGFELAYDRAGSGPAVVLLHGWPGDRTDYRDLVPLLSGCEVVVPDLRGFGHSDKHVADPVAQYSGPAQARSVADLITSLGISRAVVVGYDIGSRIAQALARSRPDLVSALVISPPVPGVGTRVFGPGPLREFWYQPFHRLPLSEQLIDGNPDAVRAYLRHFWEHWSGPRVHALRRAPRPPGLRLRAARRVHGLGAVVPGGRRDRHGRRCPRPSPAPEDRLATPAVVLWPEHDPLFPREWSDRIDEFFSRARLRFVDGAGHYAPLEYPSVIAEEVRGFLAEEPA